MLSRIKRLPSPALLISCIALVLAVGGGSFALAISDKKSDKKIAKKVANRQITKRAPNLSVNHSNSADSATNASQLGGTPAGDYLLAHSRGVALAGAKFAGNGVVDSWFNTSGGKPTVSHTASGGYDITFPGVNTSQTVIEATLAITNAGGEIEVDGDATPMQVLTHSSAGGLADKPFYLTIYGASSSG